MEHMDGEWSKRKFDAPLLKMLPSEYMRCGRVFVSCEPDEKTLPYVAEWLGADSYDSAASTHARRLLRAA